MTGSLKLSAFLEAQAAELDASENTLLAYGRDLKDFIGWLDKKDLAVETAQRNEIEEYLMELDDAGLAQSTRARRLSAIKQYFRFAFEEGWREDNPAIQIRGPKKKKSLPKTLSEDDVERLLSAAGSHGRPVDQARNVCRMELLYATGMRVSEVVALPVSAARGDP